MKECIICGYIMDDDHDGEICECCLDELLDIDPGPGEEEEF